MDVDAPSPPPSYSPPPTRRLSMHSRRASTPDAVLVAARTCPGCVDVAAAAADLTKAGGADGIVPAVVPCLSRPAAGGRSCYCCRRGGFCRACCRRYLLLDPERVRAQWAELQAPQRVRGAAAAAAHLRAASSTGGGGGGRRRSSAAASVLGGDDDDAHGWGWMQEHGIEEQERRLREREREEAEARRRDAAARLEAAVARAAAKKADAAAAVAAARGGKKAAAALGGVRPRSGSSSTGSRIPASPPALASFAPLADEAWESAPDTPPRGPPSFGRQDEHAAEQVASPGSAHLRPQQQQQQQQQQRRRRRGRLPPPHAPPPAVSARPERVCGACFDRHADYDPSRDHDAYGPPEPPTLSCTRPPVVLLPPGPAGRGALRPLAEALASLHFRAEAVDLPGLGSRWREGLSPDGALAAVDAAVRRGLARGHGRVLLAGHGMGGFLAARYASLRPGSLLGVVATGCSFRADAPAARLARVAEGAALALAGERGGGARRAARRQLLLVGRAEEEEEEEAEGESDNEAALLERCLLRGAGAERRAWRGCADVFRECGDMPAQLRACREGRVPVLLSSRGGGGGGGGGEGAAAASKTTTAAERACFDALGPYGHRLSASVDASAAGGRRRGGGGGGAHAFPYSARRAAAWAAAVAAFCDERI